MGGVLAALITIFGTMALVTVKSGVALSQITPIMGVLQDQFASLVPVVQSVGNFFISVANLIVNNLDRILISLSVVAAFVAGRWVAAFIAGGGAVTILNGALNLLRWALIRLPFVGVIVAVTELIYQLLRLREATGSWGEVLRLLSDVAMESWERMKRGLQATVLQMRGNWMQFKGAVAGVLADTVNYFTDFGNNVAGIAVGTVEGFKAVFGLIPAAVGEIMVTAANNIIAKVESMFQAVIDGANTFVDAINGALGTNLGRIGNADFGEITNNFQGAGQAAAGAFSGAFNSAMNTDYLGPVANSLQQYADQARITGDALVATGQHLADMNNAPMQSVQALRDAAAGLNDTQYDVRDWFGGVEEAAGGGGGGDGGATGAVKKLADAFKELKSTIAGSIETMFMDIVKGTASVGDAFRKMAADIIAEMFRVMMVQKWVAGIMDMFSFFTGMGPMPGSTASILGTVDGARASGGPVSGGKTYVVGEEGPELFSPSISGTITPNSDLASGGAAPVVIEQHFHVSTGVSQTVRAELFALMPTIKQQTVAAVEDARRRNQTR